MGSAKTFLWIGIGLLTFSFLVLAAPFGNALLSMIVPGNTSSDPQGGMFDGFIIIFGTLPLGAFLTLIGFFKLVGAKKHIKKDGNSDNG